ncbi:MAG TPA: hypothetical protein VH591_18565 [Ktedonobacterales bacterium]
MTIDWGNPPLVTTTVTTVPTSPEIWEIVIVCLPPGGSVPCVGESVKLVGSESAAADQFADRVVLGLAIVTVVVALPHWMVTLVGLIVTTTGGGVLPGSAVAVGAPGVPVPATGILPDVPAVPGSGEPLSDAGVPVFDMA